MSSGLLGKKLGMMSLFSSEGMLQPVTVVQAGPCVVTQIKTVATDGYNALQLGFGEKKASRVNNTSAGLSSTRSISICLGSDFVTIVHFPLGNVK